MTGPLLRDPLLSGDITVDRAEITVPETLGGGAAALDVKHIDASKAVRETLRRAKASDGTPVPRSRPSVVRLDVNVSAPSRMFVRGRGLDAELGGSVRLTGPITGIQPVGGFRLIRGRLSILGQRITFDEGTVSLVGDLDPFLDFVARSSGSDITVFITVRGRVSDLDITFSSQPELPQDEVLARLIFNRGINELSAFQIAQLAAAAAELAGGSNNSLLGGLRAATGLDDLDVVTDSEGNAAVRAGRYIQDNVYLGIEAGEQRVDARHDQPRHYRGSEGAGFARREWRYRSRHLLREGLLTGFLACGDRRQVPSGLAGVARQRTRAICQAWQGSCRWHDRLPRLALCRMPLHGAVSRTERFFRNPPQANNFASSLSLSSEPSPIQSCTFPWGHDAKPL